MRTVCWLVVAGVVVCGCWSGAARDRDVDGLVGRADACPDAPETPNGWADEDGCPDALARLRVRVTRKGQPAVGVAVSLPGARPQITDAAGVAVFLELLPVPDGAFVQVDDGEVRRDRRAPLAEGANTVHIELGDEVDP